MDPPQSERPKLDPGDAPSSTSTPLPPATADPLPTVPDPSASRPTHATATATATADPEESLLGSGNNSIVSVRSLGSRSNGTRSHVSHMSHGNRSMSNVSSGGRSVNSVGNRSRVSMEPDSEKMEPPPSNIVSTDAASVRSWASSGRMSAGHGSHGNSYGNSQSQSQSQSGSGSVRSARSAGHNGGGGGSARSVGRRGSNGSANTHRSNASRGYRHVGTPQHVNVNVRVAETSTGNDESAVNMADDPSAMTSSLVHLADDPSAMTSPSRRRLRPSWDANVNANVDVNGFMNDTIAANNDAGYAVGGRGAQALGDNNSNWAHYYQQQPDLQYGRHPLQEQQLQQHQQYATDEIPENFQSEYYIGEEYPTAVYESEDQPPFDGTLSRSSSRGGGDRSRGGHSSAGNNVSSRRGSQMQEYPEHQYPHQQRQHPQQRYTHGDEEGEEETFIGVRSQQKQRQQQQRQEQPHERRYSGNNIEMTDPYSDVDSQASHHRPRQDSRSRDRNGRDRRTPMKNERTDSIIEEPYYQPSSFSRKLSNRNNRSSNHSKSGNNNNNASSSRGHRRGYDYETQKSLLSTYPQSYDQSQNAGSWGTYESFHYQDQIHGGGIKTGSDNGSENRNRTKNDDELDDEVSMINERQYSQPPRVHSVGSINGSVAGSVNSRRSRRDDGRHQQFHSIGNGPNQDGSYNRRSRRGVVRDRYRDRDRDRGDDSSIRRGERSRDGGPGPARGGSHHSGKLKSHIEGGDHRRHRGSNHQNISTSRSVGGGRSVASSRRGGSVHSDDSTLEEVFDDDRGNRGANDGWSISKSVFSTLPQRRSRGRESDNVSYLGMDDDLADDQEDDGMVSSVISSSSHSMIHSKSRRGMREKRSSVHSNLSQYSSQRSNSQNSLNSRQSQRLVARRVYEDEVSDVDVGATVDDEDSMDSILEGFDAERSVHSSLEDSARGIDRQQNPVVVEEEGSFLFEKTSVAANFEGTLSQLDNMGLGIGNTVAPAGKVAGADVEKDPPTVGLPSKRDFLEEAIGNEEVARAWWIQELEDAGWFQHDTSTVYLSRMPQIRQLATAKEARRVGGSALDKSLTDAEETVPIPSQNVHDVGDDVSTTSTIGLENEDVGDWEERLWTLARAHCAEFRGEAKDSDISHGDISDELDNESIKEQLYQGDHDLEQKQVLEFRLLLLNCIEAYVDAFHGNYKAKAKGEKTTKIGEEEWNDYPIELSVDHYIPLPTAQALFREVIQMNESKKAPTRDEQIEVALDDGGESDSKIERKACLVASVLVEDALNIFRRYQVSTTKKLTKITSGSKRPKSRKRLNKVGAKNSNELKEELDQFLYGDMFEEEAEEKEQLEDDDGAKHDDMLQTEEIEIRIRSAVIETIRKKADAALVSEEVVSKECWVEVLTSNILLPNVRNIIKGSSIRKDDMAEQNPTFGEGPISEAPNPDFVTNQVMAAQPLTQPINDMYSLRSTPTYILRALTSKRGQRMESIEMTDVHYKDLTDLLFNDAYAKKRFELQGPYDGTMTHLSNWENSFLFLNNTEQRKRDDIDEFVSIHTVLISSLSSFLQSLLDETGIKAKKSDNTNESGDQPNPTEDDDDEDNITVENYADMVATCLEIGRSLHHLGVCLGRRQREYNDNKSGTDGAQGGKDVKSSSDHILSTIVPLEINAYRHALEAYKSAIYILSSTEKSIVTVSEIDNTPLKQSRGRNSLQNQPNALRHFQGERNGADDELHQIRDAKITIELHLADTLTCLGYCHDSKLSEYDKSLKAYRESLSLYIRHVGRFHRMVSNTLHNMGNIHAELKQWSEASSCYRQSLAILKRKEEQERSAWLQSKKNESGDISSESLNPQTFVSSMNEDIAFTLQCLGSSLSEVGEFDVSIACFQESIERMKRDDDNFNPDIPSPFVGEILSQMANIYLNQASGISQKLNWQSHVLLFSGVEGKKSEDPRFLMARQTHMELKGKDCVKKAITSRRNVCYVNHKDIFSSEIEAGLYASSQTIDDDIRIISNESSTVQLSGLAKDLIVAGKLAFRTRTYKVALSYFYEALLINAFLILRDSGSKASANEIRNVLRIQNDEPLKSGEAALIVSNKVVDSMSLVTTSSASQSSFEFEFVQLLFLIGNTHSRNRDFDNASKVMRKAEVLLIPVYESLPNYEEAKKSINDIIVYMDIATLHVRMGVIDQKNGELDSAISHMKEALQIYTNTKTHCTAEAILTVPDVFNGTVHMPQNQRKQLDMSVNNGLASALHYLGQIYMEQEIPDKAMKCLEDSVQILNAIHDARVDLSGTDMQLAFPFGTRCFWEEIPVLSTVMILSDANERSGRINMSGGVDHFSLQCFERAIGLREFFTSKVGSLSNTDAECALESFDESLWDEGNMNCYVATLMLLERKDEETSVSHEYKGEEKSWKVGHKFGFGDDVSERSHRIKDGDSLLTKEDILFRIGILQAKSGQYKDAIKSFQEAEDLTVLRLGTSNHPIVMNILLNLGNAYRSIALVSSSKNKESLRDKAIVCYSEAIRISKEFFGNHHVSAADPMQNLAVLHMGTGSAWTAVLKEEHLGDESGDLAYNLFKDALDIRRNEKTSQSELDSAFISYKLGELCLEKIGCFHQQHNIDILKTMDDALKYLSESLKIRKLMLGDDHAEVGNTHLCIGIAHVHRSIALKFDPSKANEEVEKASIALDSAIKIHRSILSAFSFDVTDDELNDTCVSSRPVEAHCLFYLGRLDEIRNKPEEARIRYMQALRLFQSEGKRRVSKMARRDNRNPTSVYSESTMKTELDAIHLWTAIVLFQIARIHVLKKSHTDAINCYKESLRIRSQCRSVQKHGINNALIQFELARTLYDAKRYEESAEIYSHCLRSYLNEFGKDSLDVADTLCGMGKSFAMLGKFQKSMQCYDKAMRVFEFKDGLTIKEKKGMLHREIGHTLELLDGDILEALEHYRSSVSFLEEFNEESNHDLSACRKSDVELNKQLLLYYSEMLSILRQAFDSESDNGELSDEIGDVLHRMGNLHAAFAEYDEAMNCFSEVLDIQRKTNHDELRIADLLFNMGNIYLEQGLPEKSLECLQESYAITTEALGEGNKELHSTMYLIGVALTELTDYREALQWFNSALSVLKANEDEEKDENARGRTLHRMGAVHERLGDPTKALACFQETAHILKTVGGNDLELSNALNSTGNLLRNMSDFDRALGCYDQSLRIRTVLGDQLMIANTKNNIGAALSSMEDLERAMAFSAEALRIKTLQLGFDNVETGRTLVNVGQLYLDKRLYSNSMRYFQEALRIFRSTLHEDHPDIAVCMHNIGVIMESRSDDASSLKHYLEAIRIFKSSEASESNVTLAFSLHNSALIYARQQNFAVALQQMEEAFHTKSVALGANHSETALSQHWLGSIHLELGDAEAALANFKGALKIRVSCSGTENRDVAKTLFGLGEVHFRRDEFQEAVECLNENLRVLRKLGSDDVEMSQSVLILGNSYQELGEFDTAKRHLSEALRMMIAIHGSNHLDVALALFRLGICLCETNHYEESLEKFQECLRIRIMLLGNRDVECANTYESIGIVQQKMERHEDAVHSFERALAIKKTSLDDDDEDFGVLMHFIGNSLFALEKYINALSYFEDSTERKKTHYGVNDEEYAMAVVDKAATYVKLGDETRAMESYHEAIESGGLPSDSWELGVAHKYLGGFFFNQNMFDASYESYNEAVGIFEWCIDNGQVSTLKYNDVVQCYTSLLELEDDRSGPISESRGTLCYKLANSYVQVNRHEDAILMYREAIMIQSQIFGADHLSVANSLHNLGNCYRDVGDFDKSADCLSKSLSLSTAAFGDDHEDVADTCHCLAVTMTSRCELDDAIPLFERALAVRRKKLVGQDTHIASSLYNLAAVFQMKGQWNNAMRYCKEALKIQRLSLGDDNPVTVRTLECIGYIHKDKRDFENALHCFSTCVSHGNFKLHREIAVIYLSRGEQEKASEMFLKAILHAREQLGFPKTEEDPRKDIELMGITSLLEKRKEDTDDKEMLHLGQNIMFLGSVLINLELFDKALECYRFSNIIFQARYGPDHLTIAENLHQCGFILETLSGSPSYQNQLDEAHDLLTEALRIRKLHLVESHPDLEETMLCLGRVHHKLGHRRNALNFLTGAVRARDARLGRRNARLDDADALLQVGQLQQQSGNLRLALSSFEDCLHIRQEFLGEDHPSCGELLFFIGNLLREAGDLDLAQERFQESQIILEKACPDSDEVADVLFSLGVLHTEQKKFSEAIDAYVRSLHIRRSRGASNIIIAEILNNIGLTYFETKEYKKAQIYHTEALEALTQEVGENHVDVAFCWHSLGSVHLELCEYVDALSCFQNAVQLERTDYTLQSLGICLVHLNDNENAFVCLDESLRMKNLEYTHDADDDVAEIQRHLGIVWTRRKKYEDALKCFEHALKIKTLNQTCESSDRDHKHLMSCLDGALEAVSELYGNQHLNYAKLLHQKGNLHGAKKEHSLAIEAYVETLRVYKTEYGDSHLSVANTLFNLGVSLNEKGSPDKAIRCFTKALRITKSRLGNDHLDVADTYDQLGTSNKLILNYEEAISYFEKALQVRKQVTGGNDLKSSVIMHEMGKIYCEEELWDHAERAFKESLRIRTVQLGQDSGEVAESMFSLGFVYTSRGDDEKALKHYEGSLRIYKTKLAKSDPLLVDNFSSLGNVHHSLGNKEKALFCHNQAIKLYTEIYGKHDEKVALSLACKGDILRTNGRYEDALSCFTECLDIRKSYEGSMLSKESADVLCQMGLIHSILKDNANAASCLSSALTTYKQIFGAKHIKVADVLYIMADHFVKVGELERGYSCVKEALALQEELLGKTSAEAGYSQYCMGTILFAWNEFDEASKCFAIARESHIQKRGATHISVAKSNFYLGCICEKLGDLESAVQYLQDSLAGKREHLEKTDPEIAENLTRLGHVYCERSEWDSAVDCFSDCLKIREAIRGIDTSSQILVADALFDLGTALNKALDTKRSMQLFTDALKEYLRHLDQHHLKVAKCHSRIGEVYEKENELSKAISSLQKAASIYEHNFGAGEPREKEVKALKYGDDYTGQAETLFHLATAHDRQGDEAPALKLYRKAMKLYKMLFGRDSLHVAKILNRLANMKGRAGSVDKAMVLFDESLRIRMLHLGNNHEDVAETLFGMGIVFEKRRDYGAAMKAYSDCLRIRSSKFGSDSMEVAQVVVNIGVVRGNKGDFAGALKSWNKALAIYRKHGLSDDDVLVSTVLGHKNLANSLIENRGSRNHK